MPKEAITQQRNNLQALLQQDPLLASVFYYFLEKGSRLADVFQTKLVPRYVTQNHDGEIDTLCPNNVIEDDRLNKNYCFVFNENELLFYPDIANSNDHFTLSHRTDNTKDGKPRLDISFFVEKGHNPHGGVGIIYYGLGTFFYKQGENLQLKNTTSKGNTRVNKVFSGLHHYLSKDELNYLSQQHPNESINCEPVLFKKIKNALNNLENTAKQEYTKNKAFKIKQKRVKIDIDGLPYITQRNLGYRTLYDVLQQDLSGEILLSTENKLKLIYNLIKAYEALPNNYAHLDLKPENILVDDNYNVRIIDFGLAAKIGRYVRDACTPAYKAPELLFLQHFLDTSGHNFYGAYASQNIMSTKAIDLYALGVILEEIVSHQSPIQILDCYIDLYKKSIYPNSNNYYTAKALYHFNNSPKMGNQMLIDMLDVTDAEKNNILSAINSLKATNTSERTFFSDKALLSLKDVCQNWKKRPPTDPAILCQKAQVVISQQLSLFSALKNIANYFELDLKAQPLSEPSTDSLESYVMAIRQNHRTNIAFRQQLIMELSKFDTKALYVKTYTYLSNKLQTSSSALAQKINQFVTQCHKIISEKLIPDLLHKDKIDNSPITCLRQLEKNIISITTLNTPGHAAGLYATNARYSYSGHIGGGLRTPIVNPFK